MITKMNPFDELKQISDAVHEGVRTEWATDAIKILGKHGIRVRDKDGKLVQATFSIPQSEGDCFVLGLRYEKNDGSDTEDLFVFRKGSIAIEPHYKGRLQRIFKEYAGTHKAGRTS